jgi:hypothetical protein
MNFMRHSFAGEPQLAESAREWRLYPIRLLDRNFLLAFENSAIVQPSRFFAYGKAIFTADLRHRSLDFQVPSDPLADTAWILLLQRV